jgi:hypothetical protein
VKTPASVNNVPSSTVLLYFSVGRIRGGPLHDHLPLFFSNLFRRLVAVFCGLIATKVSCRRGWSTFIIQWLQLRTYTRSGGP